MDNYNQEFFDSAINHNGVSQQNNGNFVTNNQGSVNNGHGGPNQFQNSNQNQHSHNGPNGGSDVNVNGQGSFGNGYLNSGNNSGNNGNQYGQRPGPTSHGGPQNQYQNNNFGATWTNNTHQFSNSGRNNSQNGSNGSNTHPSQHNNNNAHQNHQQNQHSYNQHHNQHNQHQHNGHYGNPNNQINQTKNQSSSIFDTVQNSHSISQNSLNNNSNGYNNRYNNKNTNNNGHGGPSNVPGGPNGPGPNGPYNNRSLNHSNYPYNPSNNPNFNNNNNNQGPNPQNSYGGRALGGSHHQPNQGYPNSQNPSQYQSSLNYNVGQVNAPSVNGGPIQLKSNLQFTTSGPNVNGPNGPGPNPLQNGVGVGSLNINGVNGVNGGGITGVNRSQAPQNGNVNINNVNRLSPVALNEQNQFSNNYSVLTSIANRRDTGPGPQQLNAYAQNQGPPTQFKSEGELKVSNIKLNINDNNQSDFFSPNGPNQSNNNQAASDYSSNASGPQVQQVVSQANQPQVANPLNQVLAQPINQVSSSNIAVSHAVIQQSEQNQPVQPQATHHSYQSHQPTPVVNQQQQQQVVNPRQVPTHDYHNQEPNVSTQGLLPLKNVNVGINNGPNGPAPNCLLPGEGPEINPNLHSVNPVQVQNQVQNQKLHNKGNPVLPAGVSTHSHTSSNQHSPDYLNNSQNSQTSISDNRGVYSNGPPGIQDNGPVIPVSRSSYEKTRESDERPALLSRNEALEPISLESQSNQRDDRGRSQNNNNNPRDHIQNQKRDPREDRETHNPQPHNDLQIRVRNTEESHLKNNKITLKNIVFQSENNNTDGQRRPILLKKKITTDETILKKTRGFLNKITPDKYRKLLGGVRNCMTKCISVIYSHKTFCRISE